MELFDAWTKNITIVIDSGLPQARLSALTDLASTIDHDPNPPQAKIGYKNKLFELIRGQDHFVALNVSLSFLNNVCDTRSLSVFAPEDRFQFVEILCESSNNDLRRIGLSLNFSLSQPQNISETQWDNARSDLRKLLFSDDKSDGASIGEGHSSVKSTRDEGSEAKVLTGNEDSNAIHPNLMRWPQSKTSIQVLSMLGITSSIRQM
jgi:hypothetical protein